MATGSCLCGGVAFEVGGPLTRIELCHCARCKKAYGSAFAATLYAWRRHFRWLRGEARVTTYDAPLRSAPPAYRHVFCGVCGSPLPISLAGEDLVEIPAALLDEDSGSKPEYHMFIQQKAPWFEISDSRKQFDAGAPLAEKVVQELLRRRTE